MEEKKTQSKADRALEKLKQNAPKVVPYKELVLATEKNPIKRAMIKGGLLPLEPEKKNLKFIMSRLRNKGHDIKNIRQVGYKIT